MERSLIEIDIRIEKLREVIAAGKATLQSGSELDALIEKRHEILEVFAKKQSDAQGKAGVASSASNPP